MTFEQFRPQILQHRMILFDLNCNLSFRDNNIWPIRLSWLPQRLCMAVQTDCSMQPITIVIAIVAVTTSQRIWIQPLCIFNGGFQRIITNRSSHKDNFLIYFIRFIFKVNLRFASQIFLSLINYVEKCPNIYSTK